MNWEDLQKEPTIDLIGYIKCRDQPEYRVLADAAFVAFTFRFQTTVVDKCRKIGKKFKHDNETCDSIAEETFERFYKYPFRFHPGKCGDLDIDTCVTLYLFRIAQRAFFDHYNKTKAGETYPYDGSESVIVDFLELDNMDLDDEDLERYATQQAKIEQILNTLSEKHKVIYLTYKVFEHKGFKLPRELLKKLREELELSQSSIRVYKKEVFDEVNRQTKKK